MFIGQLIIIQVVTFIVLILLLRLLFYRHLSSALARLRKLNEENLAREEALKDELSRAKREREAEIVKGKEEAKSRIEEAKREAEKFKNESLAQTKEQVKAMVIDAERRAKRVADESMRKSEEKILDTSCEVIQHIFSGEGQDALHQNLIDELIKEVKSIDKQKLKTDQTKASVTSAHPLTPEQKKNLEEILFSKTGNRINLEEKINKDTVAGIVIKLGTLVIDGSINNKLRKIVFYLKNR